MKSISGAILLVASSVFYLARINAQPINFHEAIRFASMCSLMLAVAGIIFMIWGIKESLPKDTTDSKDHDLEEGKGD